MEIDTDRFLNRVDEIRTFKSLLDHRRRRVLLLYGLEERGKTRLRQELQQVCRERKILFAVVDFYFGKTLNEPEKVIRRLRERFGGDFARQMRQAEDQIDQELAPAQAVWPGPADAQAPAPSALPQGPGSSVHLEHLQNVHIGGSVVARDNYTIQDSVVVLNPGGRQTAARGEAGTRRNTAFREVLKGFQGEQKVILFFDHVERATETVWEWLLEELLSLHLEGSDEFPNLWLVVSGRRVPLQDESDLWHHLLASLLIGPLPEQAVMLFWADECGLDRAAIRSSIQESKGSTRDLCLRLRMLYQQSLAERGGG